MITEELSKKAKTHVCKKCQKRKKLTERVIANLSSKDDLKNRSDAESTS